MCEKVSICKSFHSLTLFDAKNLNTIFIRFGNGPLIFVPV